MVDEYRMRHVCEECGYSVAYMGELAKPIEHLEDGGHKWTIRSATRLHFSPDKEYDELR